MNLSMDSKLATLSRSTGMGGMKRVVCGGATQLS